MTENMETAIKCLCTDTVDGDECLDDAEVNGLCGWCSRNCRIGREPQDNGSTPGVDR